MKPWRQLMGEKIDTLRAADIRGAIKDTRTIIEIIKIIKIYGMLLIGVLITHDSFVIAVTLNETDISYGSFTIAATGA